MVKCIVGLEVFGDDGKIAKADQEKSSTHQQIKAILLSHKGRDIADEDNQRDRPARTTQKRFCHSRVWEVGGQNRCQH